MVLGPEDGEQEAEEKHHQAEADQADDWRERERGGGCGGENHDVL